MSIARKEARHIRRDPVTLAAALGLPVLLVCFFGFVIDLNVREVGLLVADGDNTRASRELTELVSSSGYFKVSRAASAAEATRALGDERALHPRQEQVAVGHGTLTRASVAHSSAAWACVSEIPASGSTSISGPNVVPLHADTRGRR